MTKLGIHELAKLLPPKNVITRQIIDADPDICVLLSQSHDLLQSQNFTDAHKIIDMVLDKTWEDLNTGHWSSVPLYNRYVYSVASLMMVLVKVKQANQLINDERKIKLSEALSTADHGLLLGGQLHNELTKTAQILTLEISSYENKKDVNNTVKISSSLPEFAGVHGDPIPILSCPSLETFCSLHFNPRKPVKLTDCINHWPAITKWKDINYLLNKAGERTVPIELGSKYDDSEWSQKLMKFRNFVEEHVLKRTSAKTCTKSETGYLAQHQLFIQIPELKEDIREPEFCCCSDLKEEEEEEETLKEIDDEVDINAWFGPEGTVSPLHYDPKHNLLAQVVGRKRVILYEPKYSDRLCPHDDRLLFNTAQVDPENPDYNSFPSYKNTPVLETILYPGEMLYIPPTWWHHVRSLDISFSVSFWW